MAQKSRLGIEIKSINECRVGVDKEQDVPARSCPSGLDSRAPLRMDITRVPPHPPQRLRFGGYRADEHITWQLTGNRVKICSGAEQCRAVICIKCEVRVPNLQERRH